jgi:hypothetical protein
VASRQVPLQADSSRDSVSLLQHLVKVYIILYSYWLRAIFFFFFFFFIIIPLSKALFY